MSFIRITALLFLITPSLADQTADAKKPVDPKKLVRREAMAKARQGPGGGSTFAESLDAFMPLMGKKVKPSVSDNIAKTNLATVERVGVQAIESILEDIAGDRRTSYARASSA